MLRPWNHGGEGLVFREVLEASVIWNHIVQDYAYLKNCLAKAAESPFKVQIVGYLLDGLSVLMDGWRDADVGLRCRHAVGLTWISAGPCTNVHVPLKGAHLQPILFGCGSKPGTQESILSMLMGQLLLTFQAPLLYTMRISLWGLECLMSS